MMSCWAPWGVAVAFTAGLGGTWLMLRLGRAWRLLDRPNERSAHLAPMPTAGGLGIVLGFWLGESLVLWFCRARMQPLAYLPALAAATVPLLAIVVDDLVRPLKPREKTALMGLAALAWLVWGHAPDRLSLPLGAGIPATGWGSAVAVLWILALCNAYNFMDGIDGMTGVQTVCVCGSAALCLWRLGGDWISPVVLAASVSGFLVLNLPPARIFMGDVGSTFIGFALACLALEAETRGLPLWLFAVLTGHHLLDTGYTLARRLLAGENVLQAHRKHLYQRLSRLGWPPRSILAWVLLIDLLLGASAYAYLFIGSPVALTTALAALAMMAGEILWIEARDRSFR